jgi:seryl-tRNA synthetase
MIDLDFVRQNKEKVEKAIKDKGYEVNLAEILKLDQSWREKLAEVEKLRAKRNEISHLRQGFRLRSSSFGGQVGGQASDKSKIDPTSSRGAGLRGASEGKKIKEELKKLEPELAKIEKQLSEKTLYIPNLPLDDVPVGKGEKENVVVKKWGNPKQGEAKDHIELGKALDIINIEQAAQIAGSRFYYLKGKAVELEWALVNWILDLLKKEGFTPIWTPLLVKRDVLIAGGYIPVGEEEIYKTQDELYLVGTSEQSILAYNMGKTLDEKSLPQRYVAFSSCFRREAGSYGKDVKGILRTHQFDKVEMFSFCQPEKSKEEHQYLLGLEEKIVQSLNLPYQVVRMCTGDLGMPAADKYDIETWLPGQQKYRETHSTSNCTDFQAQRANIKYQTQNGPPATPERSDGGRSQKQFVHTLNGTAVAIGRMLIAILENYQRPDGSVEIPKVLRRYCKFKAIK